MLANPRNCESVILGHDGLGRLKLAGRCELDLKEYTSEETSNDDKERGADGIRLIVPKRRSQQLPWSLDTENIRVFERSLHNG